MFTEIAKLVSLFLTFPTIVLGLYVVHIWGRAAVQYLFKKHKDATEWLILGVTIAFLGSSVDNFYWCVGWTFNYLDCQWDIRDSWVFAWGPAVNVVFRQGCGILAAYCHIKSYQLHSANKKIPVAIWFVSILLGISYVSLITAYGCSM